MQCQKVSLLFFLSQNIFLVICFSKAALSLFIKHAEQFDEFIYDDYEQLFQRISNWAHHKNYDMKKLAYAALDPFYKQVSLIFNVQYF